MKLYYKGTDKEVQKGDVLTDSHGDKAVAFYWREPNHGIGKISVKDVGKENEFGCFEYYVSVFNLEWR